MGTGYQEHYAWLQLRAQLLIRGKSLLNSLPHVCLIVCLQLEGAAITLNRECGVVLVLLGRSDLLNTEHFVNINVPAQFQ
jgi:hypothetical protein